MLITGLTILVVLISIGAPLWLSIILFALNAYIPDSIPYADEFIQGMNIAGKVKHGLRGMKIFRWLFK